MTPADLRALIDAASKAGAGTWSTYYAAATPDVVSALARIALAAVEHERFRSAVAACRARHLEEYDADIKAMLQSRADLVAALADAGLLPEPQEPQP